MMFSRSVAAWLVVAVLGACARRASPAPPRPALPPVARARTAPPGLDPTQWHAMAPPDRSSPAYRCAAFSDLEWSVVQVDGVVRALPPPPWADDAAPAGVREPPLPERTLRRVLRVAGGHFVGYDAGEFGGSLWFFPDGGGAGAKLFDRNVADFVRTDFGLFAAFGLEHISMNQGGLLRLERAPPDRGSTWTARPFVEFYGAPRAFERDGPASLLVLSSAGLVRVDASGSAGFAHRSLWIYPGSIVREASTGRLYVGMRYAVVRLTPSPQGYREEWLVRDRCDDPRFDESTQRCTCGGADGGATSRRRRARGLARSGPGR